MVKINRSSIELIKFGKTQIEKYLKKEDEIKDNLYKGIVFLYCAYAKLSEDKLNKLCLKKRITIRKNCKENAFIRCVWSEVKEDTIKESKLFTYARCIRNMSDDGIKINNSLEYLRKHGVDKIANPRVNSQNKLQEDDKLKTTLKKTKVKSSEVNDDKKCNMSQNSLFIGYLKKQGYDDKPCIFYKNKHNNVYYSNDENFCNFIKKEVKRNIYQICNINNKQQTK